MLTCLLNIIILSLPGDVLYSREDVENGVSQKEKVVAIYGHALRFANSDSAKFQIYDRLAVLKVLCLLYLIISNN